MKTTKKINAALALPFVLGVLSAASAFADDASSGNGSNGAATMTLNDIKAKQAELKMLTLDAAIMKARQPLDEAQAKASSQELQAQLDKAASAQQGAASQEQAMSITVLSIYGLGDNLIAEVKVGDMMIQAKKGMRLPNGMVVEEIDSDSVVVKSKKRKPETVYISSSESESIYASRGKSGVTAVSSGSGANSSAGAAAPGGLPPLPGR